MCCSDRILWLKTMLGTKWFISGYRLWSIIEENQAGNSNSNSHAGLLAISHSFKLCPRILLLVKWVPEKPCRMQLSGWLTSSYIGRFLIQLMITCSGNEASYSGLPLFYQLTIKTIPNRHVFSPVWSGKSLNWDFFLSWPKVLSRGQVKLM